MEQIVIILKFALMLLIAVQANPSIDPAFREQAITFSTEAMQTTSDYLSNLASTTTPQATSTESQATSTPAIPQILATSTQATSTPSNPTEQNPGSGVGGSSEPQRQSQIVRMMEVKVGSSGEWKKAVDFQTNGIRYDGETLYARIVHRCGGSECLPGVLDSVGKTLETMPGVSSAAVKIYLDNNELFSELATDGAGEVAITGLPSRCRPYLLTVKEGTWPLFSAAVYPTTPVCE